MVRTRIRTSAPPALEKHRAAWTSRYKENQRRDWATPKAKAVLRSALLDLAHGKCVYCEKRLAVTDFPQIDHYHPKSKYPDLSFEWENLLPACSRCNTSKGEEDHKGALIKPDAEDPEPYFWIAPEGRLEPHPALGESNRQRAQQTIRILDLNRPALMQSRFEMRVRKDLPDLVGEPLAEHKLVLRHVLTISGQAALAALDRMKFL